MKTFVFILLFIFTFVQNVFAQSGILDRKVKIDSKDGTIGSVLEEISIKGGFVFTYGHDIPHDSPVTLKYSRQSVREFLDEIFGQNLNCVEYGNKLIIRLKPILPEIYTVRGKVVDAETKEPIPGVTVYIPGSDPLIGSVSDPDGIFKIDVPTGVTNVQLSCMGYVKNSLQPEENKNANIELIPEKQELSEVEIVYYQKPKSEELNNAISSINTKQLEKLTAGSIEESLQGNVAGVHVVRNSGMPGASLQVKIRGINSLINAEPVYYLDDIYIQPAALYSISPNDIEKVEVLKDASGTAKYGALAGNGVVLLHSRKSTNKKTGVTLNYSFGMQKAWRKPELMDTTEFLQYFRLVRPSDKIYDKLDSLYCCDWMDLIFHDATAQNFHLSFFGGNDRSDFYVSSGYFKQEAIINKLNLIRYSFKVNANHTIRQGFTFGENISLAYMQFSGLKEGCFLNDLTNPILGAMCMPPVKSPHDSTQHWLSDGPRITNIYENVELNNNVRKNYALTARLHSRVRLLPSVHYSTHLGIGLYFQDNISFNRVTSSSSNTDDLIYGSSYNILDLSFDWHNSINYSTEFADHHVLNSGIQFEFGQSKSEWIPIDHTQYDNSLKIIPDETGDLNANFTRHRTTCEFSHNAWLGFIQYTVKNKYFFDIDMRREVLNFYDLDQNIVDLLEWYPSISLGWIFTEENFFPIAFINYGKLRFGWGKAGNSQRVNYSFFAKMMRDMEYVYAFNTDARVTSSANNRMTNGKFYHEIIQSHNIGMDLGLWQNQLFFSVDYFNTRLNEGQKIKLDKPKAIIQYINQMGQFGLTSHPTAIVRNTGFEFELNYKHTGRNLMLDIGFNYTHFQNRVVRVVDDSYNSFINNTEIDPISIHFDGETAGSFYGYKIDRLFREEDCDEDGFVVNHVADSGARAGDFKFADVNNDGVIDKNDKTIIGNPFPDFTYGLFFNLQYKNYDISCFFQGSYGNEIFNATKLWLYNPYGLSNWSKDVLNFYREPGYYSEDDEGLTDTDWPRYDYNNTNRNLRISDLYVEDGSYLRLKNIQFGYTLPLQITQRIHIQKLRIWLGAQNLFTYTNYSGLDPEVGGWGIDCGIYPQPRVYLAGVNVEF